MLEKTGRRWLRVIHILFIASLMGGLVSILAMNHIPSPSGAKLFIANYSIYRLFNIVVTWSFYGVLATGLVYSTFTHWGLTRHWWIIGKWVGTVSLFVLVWVWLGPAINGMVALSDIGLNNPENNHAYRAYKSSVSPVIWVLLVIIAVLVTITIFRPWGQRKQSYEFRRNTILALTGFGVVLGVGLGIMGYFDLESYRNMKISTPDLSRIADGSYEGSAEYAGFEYVVNVDVTEHKINRVHILENRDSPYAKFAEGIIERVVKQQSPDVDGITGATTTSKCLMKAIEAALEGATL